MMKKPPSVIAIDGPAAAGKTTLAKQLAAHLGYLYFDTGVLYRAITLAAVRQGLDLADADAVTLLARALTIDVLPADDSRGYRVFVDGEDVTNQIRTAEIDEAVSIPSAYAGVRTAMIEQQRRIAERGHVVMVGRDIGTVVIPGADLKLYLEASVEERARRRWQESQAEGRSDTLQDILDAMRRRDELDTKRAVAPLKPAEDAVRIDTTGLTLAEVLAYSLRIVDEAGCSEEADEQIASSPKE